MIKFALVGCGRIAKRHSELLGKGAIGNASIVAVCDIIEDRCKIIGDAYNIPYYTDMHEMMKQENILKVTNGICRWVFKKRWHVNIYVWISQKWLNYRHM